MRIHLRFDSTNEQHTKMSVFVNGRRTGQLIMSPDEADWIYLAMQRGCEVLSPKGQTPIEFVGSGHHRDGEPIPPVPPSP